MPTEKRERQRQGRQARLEAAEVARRTQQRKRTIRNVVFLIVGVIIVAFVLSRVFGGNDNKQAVSTNSSASASSSPQSSDSSASSAAAPAVTIPPAGATITGDTPCPPADGSAQRTTTFAKPPPTCIDPTKTYTATLSTSKGDVTIALDQQAAPMAVNNFVVLSRYHYYDGVAFHRVIQGFMDQSGDAVGPTPGQGGPGYEFADELPTGDKPYTDGTVAMANSGPNTNGSQFFIVVDSGGDSLQNSYTIFGHVTAGQDVAKAINASGSVQDGGPMQEVVTINNVTINES